MRTNANGTAMSRTALRSATAAGLLAGILGSGSVLAAAPSAYAVASNGRITLAAHTPASVGFAGGPVEFTETITDKGAALPVVLVLEATTGPSVMPDSLVIQYLDGSTWKSLPLTYSAGAGVFSGQTGVLDLAAGGTKTVRLRIGLPMGTPHHGDTNGGASSISLRSVVAAADGSWVRQAEDTHTIKVGSISAGLGHVPATAVAGGAPIEFDATLANPTPSDYQNLGDVLFVDHRATVQVRAANGSWSTLAPVTGPQPDPRRGFYLGGRNASSAAGSTRTFRVRISFPADAAPGTTSISPCLYVNEGSVPFLGTTMCVKGATVKVVAASTTRPTATPSRTITPAPTPTTGAGANGGTGSTGGTGTLARTGSSGTVSLALGGGALVAVGAGALLLACRRRTA